MAAMSRTHIPFSEVNESVGKKGWYTGWCPGTLIGAPGTLIGAPKFYRKFREVGTRHGEFLVFWGGPQKNCILFKAIKIGDISPQKKALHITVHSDNLRERREHGGN